MLYKKWKDVEWKEKKWMTRTTTNEAKSVVCHSRKAIVILWDYFFDVVRQLFILPANPHGRRVSCVCLFPHLLLLIRSLYMPFTFISRSCFVFVSVLRLSLRRVVLLLAVSNHIQCRVCAWCVSRRMLCIYDCVSFLALIIALRFIPLKPHLSFYLSSSIKYSLGALLFTTM